MSDDIRVDQESVLARYAELHSRTTGRPVASVGPETQRAVLFVADEVLIDGDDEDLEQELIERYDAERVDVAPLPARPALLADKREIDPDAIPHTTRLRFPAPPKVEDRAAVLERLGSEMRTEDEQLYVSSEFGASVAAVVARHALDGRSIGLNQFGVTTAMPLSTATEGPVPGAGANPFAWPAFGGRTRMVEAWQLVDSVREARGDRLITIGVLDRGFWLDNRGVPIVPPAQAASDFGARFIQLNLQDESRPAGGINPSGSAWHGNATASAAAAVVNNALGAAGSGGTVATPMFFQTDISIDQILRCVTICAAWGIDVLNMSIGTWGLSELDFPTRSWDRTFQFAFDNDVVMVAAAGNASLDLPHADDHVRPATRTPGVLTVGALDQAGNAASFSNFGSSVWLWAPGTSIPVAPDPVSPQGSLVSGTSFASPIVAGVAAMMRYVNAGLSADEIRRTLIDTGWAGDGKVGRGLDAYAAVFTALRGALPDDEEPNDTPASARNLMPGGPGGALVPGWGGFTARSRHDDRDYWRFRVDRFSTVSIAVDWYERLSTLAVSVEAEDPKTAAPEELTTTGNASSGSIVVAGMFAPGSYQVRVSGTGVTGYRMLVSRQSAPLTADIFERNDDFDRASRLLFEAPRGVPITTDTFGPGTFDATLHQERGVSLEPGARPLVMNDDYFRLDAPPADASLRSPTVAMFDADAPVDVTLYDAARAVIQTWSDVRSMSVSPPRGVTSFLKVSGDTPSRYRIRTRMSAEARLPGGLQEELELVPKWWIDPPPFTLTDVLTHLAVDVNDAREDGDVIAFARPEEALRLELLDDAGEVLRKAEAIDGRLVIDTRDVERGTYVLRVSRPDDATSSNVQLRTASPLR